MTWTLGDVSGSETLTASDHLYGAHINELRQSNTASAVVGTVPGSQYYCDGVADDVQIQAAGDALNASGGGVLFLRRGTYNNSTYINIASWNNIIVRGEGRGATILMNYGFKKNSATPTSNMEFQGFTVDANGIGTTAMHIGTNSNLFRLAGLTLKNSSSSFALNWSGVDRLLVDDCYIYDGGLTVAADNCAGSQRVDTSNTSVFRNCWIVKEFSLGGGLITTGQTGNLLVEGCGLVDLSNNSYAAVSVENQSGDSKCVQVLGNKLLRVGFNFGTGSNSHRVAKVVVANNIHEGVAGSSASGGILAQRVDDLTIAANTQSDTTYGIYTLNCGYVKIVGNKVKNTNSNSGGVADKAGIYLSGNTLSEVANNTVWDDQASATTLAGVRVVGSSNAVYLDGNKFLGSFVTASIQTTGTQSELHLYDNDLSSASLSLGTITKLYARNNKGMNADNLFSQGNVAGATTVARANGAHITATMTANCTFTITNGLVKSDTLTLELTQDGTGSRTATWPANFKKAGGALTLTTTAGATDLVSMRWDGTNWVETSRALNVS